VSSISPDRLRGMSKIKTNRKLFMIFMRFA